MLTDIPNNECIICLDEIKQTNDIWLCPQCNIEIHKTCYDNYVRHRCPHCRYKINTNNNQSAVTIVSHPRHTHRIYDCNSFMFIMSMVISIGFLVITSVVACIIFIVPEIYFIFNSGINASYIIQY